MTTDEIKEREQQVKRELRDRLATLLWSWAKAAEESDQWDSVQDMSESRYFYAALNDVVTVQLVTNRQELQFRVLVKRPGVESCPTNPTGSQKPEPKGE